MVVRKALEHHQTAREWGVLREQEGARLSCNDLIAGDPAMKRVVDLARKVAQTHATVLITGESGTGKGDRTLHPPQQPASAAGLRAIKLRGALADSDRKRVVRPRAGSVHGRRGTACRPLRTGRRRHAVSRRDRRTWGRTAEHDGAGRDLPDGVVEAEDLPIAPTGPARPVLFRQLSGRRLKMRRRKTAATGPVPRGKSGSAFARCSIG